MKQFLSLFLALFFFFSTWEQVLLKQTPHVSAATAIVMEASSKRVLFDKDAHEQKRIASITKIMTAILAIESGKMDDWVIVSDRAIRTEGSSIFLEKGEKIKLEDLVYGLMLRSGNDAAVAISEHVGGSVEGFVYLMNEKASEIGMEHTMFQNPHGLDDHEEHYSTAYDMALLTQYALGNKTFEKISGAKQYKSRATKNGPTRYWKNKNKLLQLYPYSTGGKTGYTKRAKRTLVSTAQKKNMTLICVTLNAPDDWTDHMTLFEWAYNQFRLKMIVPKGKVRLEGREEVVFTRRAFFYPLRSLEERNVRTEVFLYRNQVSDEQKVGKVEIYLAGDQLAELPVYSKK
ncbi:D-alanyl-D-alanine carboxypeptidase family protein [Massilibacterium senegalense]|uniref:D-alanyl-D-alanine carboxypeptidase family protein n=1 Tax=Massilibacterium senegalense TaxID=1632858 RepID=UPI000781A91D|nr:D-alanyl-D-alanine carboxypeptidase family protein [Massilibacterium senegalense]